MPADSRSWISELNIDGFPPANVTRQRPALKSLDRKSQLNWFEAAGALGHFFNKVLVSKIRKKKPQEKRSQRILVLFSCDWVVIANGSCVARKCYRFGHSARCISHSNRYGETRINFPNNELPECSPIFFQISSCFISSRKLYLVPLMSLTTVVN